MGASCSHHHHSMQPTQDGHFHKAFAIGAFLNISFVAVEVFFGLQAHSLALIADAVHNLTDVFSLLISWLGYYLAFYKPTQRFTYGLGRVSIYATLFNGISLVVTSLWIVYEAWERLHHPIMPNNITVAIVAAVGVVINTATALVLMRGQNDVNIKGAMLHMAADAAVSAGVIVIAFLMAATGWLWLDPAISALIALIVLVTGWPILREGFFLSLDAVPHTLNRQDINDFLAKHDGVTSVHDLHIWALSTQKTAVSAHIMITPGWQHEEVLRVLHKELKNSFAITHVTIQVEQDHSQCTDEHELN